MSVRSGNDPIGRVKYCDKNGVVSNVSIVVQNNVPLYRAPYLKFTAVGTSANYSVILRKVGNPDAINIYYSTNDGRSWNEWIDDGTGYRGVAISTIDRRFSPSVIFLCKNESFSKDTSNYYHFELDDDGSVGEHSMAVSGDVMSLLGFSDSIPNNAFCGLFKNCAISSVPKISAVSYGNYSCYEMFRGCTSITSTPDILATSIGTSGCSGMFNGCTSITTVSSLLPTTPSPSSYYCMFYGCTSLVTAPDIMATSSADTFIAEMFYGCSSLTSVKIRFDSADPILDMDGWLFGVNANGTIHCTEAFRSLVESIGRDIFGIPEGWIMTTDV